MHSSGLRGSDFKLTRHGVAELHEEFFSGFHSATRVALLTPTGLEGLGATTLIMAYVTAFYDRCRERDISTTSYPSFFTFQKSLPCADYCMLDIWPYHRNVNYQNDQQLAVAIASREIDALLVPEGYALDLAVSRVTRCFEYAASGKLEQHDLRIEVAPTMLEGYAKEVIASLSASRQGDRPMPVNLFCQFFRELEVGR